MNRTELTNKARKLFIKSGVKFPDLTNKDLSMLKLRLKLQLEHFRNDEFYMEINEVRSKIEFGKDFDFAFCELRVNGVIGDNEPYFLNREAITFNKNGFIGFGGWADVKNVDPFVTAFTIWVKCDLLNQRVINMTEFSNNVFTSTISSNPEVISILPDAKSFKEVISVIDKQDVVYYNSQLMHFKAKKWD